MVIELSGDGVAGIDVFDGAELLGTLGASPFRLEALLLRDGDHTLSAIGRDADGKEVAHVTRSITVQPPQESGCLAALSSLGVEYREGKPTKGVTDPVIVPPVIEGVTFRSWRASEPKSVLMACEFAQRMVELARLAKRLGVDEVLHMGVYNYRKMRNPKCIKKGNCKLSQHAYATALDIYGVGMANSDAVHKFEDDWVIDKSVGVCPGKPKDDGDRVLHALACKAYAERIVNVVLTPNYNSKHRNHAHMDLTKSWSGLRGEDLGVDPVVEGIDPEINGLGD